MEWTGSTLLPGLLLQEGANELLNAYFSQTNVNYKSFSDFLQTSCYDSDDIPCMYQCSSEILVFEIVSGSTLAPPRDGECANLTHFHTANSIATVLRKLNSTNIRFALFSLSRNHTLGSDTLG